MNNNTTNSARKIFVGNFFSSLGRKEYDVRIEEDGKVYYYNFSSLFKKYVKKVDHVYLENEKEVTWDFLDAEVREAHYMRTVFPETSEEEKNIFIYGPEEGEKRNKENKWADAHLIYSREFTLELKEKIGPFKKIEFQRKQMNHFCSWEEIYLIDDKFLVYVTVGMDCKIPYYRLQECSDVIARRKYFGRRVARLAKRADVPWEIGVLVGHTEDDEEAVGILKGIKAARGTLTEELQEQLSKGYMAEVLKAINVDCCKIDYSSDKRWKTLANYLLGQ